MVLVATQVKRRRGTTAENDAFTGAEGEITVDTEKHELRVHDGVTQGGFKIGGGSGALVIGQILEVTGTADYTPEGCLLADGAEYTKAQFPDLWADFLTGTPKLQTCTYTEYANQIAEYGFCNKFAVDTTNETFKVPTRNKYRKLVKKIVNSDSWANLYDDGWVEQGGYIASDTTSYIAKPITLPVPMASSNYQVQKTTHRGAGTTASSEWGWWGDALSSAPDNTSTIVYISVASITFCFGVYWQVSGYAPIPDSTSNITREFVVVANGTLNQEQMDWSAWASSLAGKANIDLSNTPANIDYVIESQEPTAGNGYTWYRKYKSGWVEQGGVSNGLNAVVTLPVEMADTNYTLVCSGVYALRTNKGSATYSSVSGDRTSTTTITLGEATGFATMGWQVSGKSAQ